MVHSSRLSDLLSYCVRGVLLSSFLTRIVCLRRFWLLKSYIKINVYIVIGFYHRTQNYKVVLYIAIYCSVVINYELNFNMFLINLIKHVLYDIENGSF